jgi:uncharacterized repeat protein (TIGR03943 family)
MGAVILTAAFVGRALSVRSATREVLTVRKAGALVLILVPVVLIAALPPAALGSFAASRRSSLVGSGITSSASDISSGPLTLIDVGGALRSRDAMRALVQRAGSTVSFVGFVDKSPGEPADEFLLSRFMVTCCVADALSIQLRVVNAPPGQFEADDWVKVTGQMYPLGKEVIIDATAVAPVPRPSHPYLYP